MRRAIITKYHGYTNTKPTRISAQAYGLSRIYISRDEYDHIDDAHVAAARKFAKKYDWGENFVSGAIEGGCVHVFPEREYIVVNKLEYALLKAQTENAI